MKDREEGEMLSDRGSGAVLVVAVAGAIMMLAGISLPLAAALATSQRVVGAADAAALAAADAAVGIEPGLPCEVASMVAGANGAGLAWCRVDGLIVTVVVRSSVLGLPVSAAATAGPPPG